MGITTVSTERGVMVGVRAELSGRVHLAHPWADMTLCGRRIHRRQSTEGVTGLCSRCVWEGDHPPVGPR